MYFVYITPVFCEIGQFFLHNLLSSQLNIFNKKIKNKKKKMEKQNEKLHSIIEQHSEMNNKLEKACPLDWSREKKEIEAKKAELLEKIDIWDSEHIAGLVDS